MKWLVRATFLNWILALNCALAGAQVEGRRLVDFQCRISILDQHSAEVSALMRVDQTGSPSTIRVTVVRYHDQNMTDLRAMDQHRNPLPFAIATEKGAMVLQAHAPEPPDQFNSEFIFIVEYTVTAPVGEIIRIPLPVPDARTSFGERSGQITVTLPDGEVPVGDTFPTLTWRDTTHASAKLADVPSLAIIHSKPFHSVTLMGKLLTTTTLSDAAMLVLVLAGSSFWWFRNRRNAGKRIAAG